MKAIFLDNAILGRSLLRYLNYNIQQLRAKGGDKISIDLIELKLNEVRIPSVQVILNIVRIATDRSIWKYNKRAGIVQFDRMQDLRRIIYYAI
jgi:hypothetical protein